jgi:tetratricopeptide (TPR) repeat protein
VVFAFGSYIATVGSHYSGKKDEMVFMGKIAIIICILGFAIAGHAQKDQQLVMEGNELYKKQQYEKAAEQYLKATDINAKNPKALYNLGNALYKTRKADGAEKAFDASAETTKDPSFKSKALYNKGVSLSRQKKLEESIDAYKKTLRLNSTDEQARQNLQKALNELKKEPPPPKPKEDKSKDKQDKKKSDSDNNNSKLNKNQVDQMLNALRQQEKKLQQNIQQRNNTGGSNTKDW